MILPMTEEITVKEVIAEKTHIGKVSFPTTVPVGLIEWLSFPDDLLQNADELGLNKHAVKFLIAALHGRCSITAPLDLPDLASKIGMNYDEMDRIVRDLIAKNYARVEDRLDLYRLWVVVLHLKGVRFVAE